MKRLILSVCLGLAFAAQVPERVAAGGTLGLCVCGSCGSCGGCGICIRPYNAFTPVLCGTTCGVGCAQPPCGCPGGCGMPGYGPGMAYGPMMGGPVGPYAYYPGPMNPPGQMPQAAAPLPQAPEQLPPAASEQPATSPKPLNNNVGAIYPQNRMPYPNVIPAGYYPMSYPAYYGYGYQAPMGYQPMMSNYGQAGYYPGPPRAQ
jgi:hypothetical protein